MSTYGAHQPNTPEFVRAAPTKGFGEIEATVIASLSAPGAPRPRPITTKPERKLCRIYSPVSTTRDVKPIGGIARLVGQRYRQDDALLRPHTADATVVCRPRTTPIAVVAQEIGIPNVSSDDAAGSSRSGMVQQRGRPMTSDASSHLRNHQNRSADDGRLRGNLSRVASDSGGAVRQLRASTSNGSRRRPPVVSHGSFDTRKVKSSAAANSLVASKNQAAGKHSSGRWQQQQQQQEEQQQDRPEQEAPEQREKTYVDPTTSDAATPGGGSVDWR